MYKKKPGAWKKAVDADDSPPEGERKHSYVPPGQQARFRLQRDFDHMDCPPNVEIYFPDVGDLQNFSLQLRIIEGYWSGGHFEFKIRVPDRFPFEAINIVALDKVRK